MTDGFAGVIPDVELSDEELLEFATLNVDEMLQWGWRPTQFVREGHMLFITRVAQYGKPLVSYDVGVMHPSQLVIGMHPLDYNYVINRDKPLTMLEEAQKEIERRIAEHTDIALYNLDKRVDRLQERAVEQSRNWAIRQTYIKIRRQIAFRSF